MIRQQPISTLFPYTTLFRSLCERRNNTETIERIVKKDFTFPPFGRVPIHTGARSWDRPLLLGAREGNRPRGRRPPAPRRSRHTSTDRPGALRKASLTAEASEAPPTPNPRPRPQKPA